MVTYTDLFTPDLFWVASHTAGHEAVLTNELWMRVLQRALHREQKRRPFRLVGYVFLPEQVHLLLEPIGSTSITTMVRAIYQQFQTEYQQLVGIPGELLLWESHHQVQRVIDVADLASRLDSMHYLPVQQHLVAKPEQWPYSSYGGWLAQGLYANGWGGTPPTRRSRKPGI
ncbi:MAG: hypothetical protein KF832_05425 [Caldilineaceae bacterium]|nr:hypothetical protein [Caldilineaceae bacterium]